MIESEHLKKTLLDLGLIDLDFFNDIKSIRIDEINKEFLINLYRLRLRINEEKNNNDGIILSENYLEKLSNCDGEKIFSILIKTSKTSRSFFSDGNMIF